MELHIETEINAPAEKVWEILAHQFAEIGEWSSTVKESRELSAGEIPSRFIPASNAPALGRETIAGPGVKLKEVITEYSEEKMELTFEGIDLPPLVFNSGKDTQSVISKGSNKCLLTFDVDMQPRGIFKVINPLLKRRMGSTFGAIQKELKVHAENDRAKA